MLVKYVRDIIGNPVACVVAVGPRQVGWSVKHQKDQFNKDIAKKIAKGRAIQGSATHLPNRNMWDYDMNIVNLADVLHDEILNMSERSVKYFK